MGLDPDYPIHSLLLDGKYDDVRESELWEPGSIIRQISANV